MKNVWGLFDIYQINENKWKKKCKIYVAFIFSCQKFMKRIFFISSFISYRHYFSVANGELLWQICFGFFFQEIVIDKFGLLLNPYFLDCISIKEGINNCDDIIYCAKV